MQVVQKVTDEEVIERFNELVQTKLDEAEQLPGAIEMRYDRGEQHFILFSGAADAVRVVYAQNGAHRMEFANQNKWAYDLQITQDSLEVLSAASSASDEDVASHLNMAEQLPVFINNAVPYGWADGDTITVVLFVSFVNESEMDDKVVNASTIFSYVLAGQRLPTELALGDDFEEYIARIWRLIREGKLMRLTDRLRGLGDNVTVNYDGVNPPYLLIEEDDGQNDGVTPDIKVGKPYMTWHPRDQVVGESFDYKKFPYDIPIKNYLGYWMR